MAKRLLIISSVLLVTLTLASCAAGGYAAGVVVANHAAHTFNATITGRITSGGIGISGALVCVEGYGIRAVTDGRGYFALRLRTTAPAGVYRTGLRLLVSRSGFHSRSVGISVRDGGRTTVNISLQSKKVIVIH